MPGAYGRPREMEGECPARACQCVARPRRGVKVARDGARHVDALDFAGNCAQSGASSGGESAPRVNEDQKEDVSRKVLRPMKSYLLKRLLVALPSLVIASVIV